MVSPAGPGIRHLSDNYSLPRPLTSFVGRENEIDAVSALLGRDDVQLVTLTGVGGVGKTRLALAAATRATDDFPDGVVFVGLAALTDSALVLSTIAQTLSVREGTQTILERLGTLLKNQSLLLVLDNLEHLTEATPEIVALLATCPHLTILATSRI